MVAYTRKIADIIEVEEIYDIIDQGTTMPVRCRLKNGMHVIVKYMKNPAGQRALINEWIGSCIADIIGLTIPEYGICNFSIDVIDQTNPNEEIDYRNAGYAFYTKTYSQTVPVLTGSILSNVKNPETEKIILFDHLVNNNDRHNGNLLCDISNGATLLTIDNSHILSEEPKKPFSIDNLLNTENILSNRILTTNNDIYELLCTRVGYSEEKLLQYATIFQEMLTEEVLQEIQASIPNVWVVSIGSTRTEQLFEILRKRISLLNEIAEMIIEERRKL